MFWEYSENCSRILQERLHGFIEAPHLSTEKDILTKTHWLKIFKGEGAPKKGLGLLLTKERKMFKKAPRGFARFLKKCRMGPLNFAKSFFISFNQSLGGNRSLVPHPLRAGPPLSSPRRRDKNRSFALFFLRPFSPINSPSPRFNFLFSHRKFQSWESSAVLSWRSGPPPFPGSLCPRSV